ncbi:MAG: exopolysaccharide biosynthesis polyprenyl glycosylphosphotransferase, partial [Pseudomonadota bacterium]|nr:exopolysaccharide biosynthesis polyprenyl glycosylphosphotransferase [Pseudomonadota bacterium]
AFSAVIWVAMIAVGSYGHQALRSIRFATARLLVAVSLGVLAIALMNFVFPGSALWRSVLLYAMGLAILFLVGNRVLTGRLLGVDNFRRTVLVLGARDRAQRLEPLAARPESGFRVAAFIAMGNAEPVVVSAVRRETIADLGRYADGLGASEVVLALQERRNSLPLKDLLRVKTKGVDVADFSSFLEREMGRVDLDTLNPSWLIFSDGFSAGRRLSSIAKRAFDIVASLLLLVVGLPLIGLFALLVKLESDGPAFFRQKRVGLYGQEFTLIKLRSMRSDAEAGGSKWAEKDDPRITRVGRFIRMVRIDELPQVWSVLKGEMSFVGPRPEVPAFVTMLDKELPYYAERHVV